MWPLIQENEDLMSYFPDLKPSQLPEKEFMYVILNTLEPEGVRELVANSVKSRAPVEQDAKDDLIEVSKEMGDLIRELYSVKSKKY